MLHFVLLPGTAIGPKCILFSTKAMLHRQKHLWALRLLHYYCGKSFSDGKSPLKMTTESAPGYQRFALVAAMRNRFLL